MVVPFEELLTNAKKDCSKLLSLVKKLEVWFNSFSNVVKITPMKSSIVSFGTFEFLVQILKKKKRNVKNVRTKFHLPPNHSLYYTTPPHLDHQETLKYLVQTVNNLVVSWLNFSFAKDKMTFVTRPACRQS